MKKEKEDQKVHPKSDRGKVPHPVLPASGPVKRHKKEGRNG